MAKGLAMGLNKGHIVTKIEIPSWQEIKRPRKRLSVVRKIIHEITGHAPYERKIMEMLKQSKQSSQKKAYKLAKKSLGTHRRALRKRNELQEAVAHHEH
jgi:large subunit ribosomal protein L36e